MIANILSLVDELKAERAAGDDMAAQLIERIDAHIRDLATLKAWITDSAAARSMAISGMVGEPATAPAPAVIEAPPQDEAA